MALAHLGFQLRVTLVLYPQLARTEPSRWSDAHDRHSRRVVVPVVGLYGALVLVAPWAWWTADARSLPWARLAVACVALLLATTLLLAAPVHARLGRVEFYHRPLLLRRLRRVDRARLALAGVLAVASVAVAARPFLG